MMTATTATLSKSERVRALRRVRTHLEVVRTKKRPDFPVWSRAWRAKRREDRRWEDWAHGLYRDIRRALPDERGLIELASESTIFKAAPPPDPEELARRISTRAPVEELLAQAVVAYIQVALATGEAAGQYTLDALGIDKTFNWAHPRNMGRDLYSVRGSKIIQLAHGTHVDELAKIIHTATDPLRPLTIQQMTTEISERWGGLEKWQAERIARTESAAVWENMNYNTMRANGVESFDNLIASGPSIGVDVEDACDYCQEMGAGSPWYPDDLGDMPPYHPNAVFAGSTFAPYGPLEELVRARYNGPAIRIRAGTHETTIGPNHPMLTSRGMVRAAEIRPGDQLLYDSRTDRSAIGTIETDIEPIPLVEDAFETVASSATHALVTVAGHDLHGDRIFCEGEVEVIRPARQLGTILDPCGIEKLRELGFAWTDPDAPHVSGIGASDKRVLRVTGHTTGVVRSGLTRMSAAAVSCFIVVTVNEVHESSFSGWAFDATTYYALYCSDGFVVSNCRCTLVPHDDVLPPQEPWAGEDIPMCGEEDVWMAKRALIERSLPHVRIKKDAASCVLPVQSPLSGKNAPLRGDEAVDSLEADYARWEPSTSVAEYEAIRVYAGIEFANVNAMAAGRKLPFGNSGMKRVLVREVIKNIDSALARAKISRSVEVWRGMEDASWTLGDTFMTNPQSVVGNIFTSKSFMSTTTDKLRAETFGNIRMRIVLPKGTRGARIEGISGAYEDEVLLPRGTQFKIKSVVESKDGKTTIIDAEVV